MYIVSRDRSVYVVTVLSTVLSGSTDIQEQCWERIEVSSGNYHKDHLTDGNKLTYWESSGRSGSHWIRLFLKKDVTIRCAYLSYCICKYIHGYL